MSEAAVVELAQATANAVGEVLGSFGAPIVVGEARIIAKEANPLEALPLPAVVSSVSYIGGVSGGNVLALTAMGARKLAAVMGAEDDGSAGDEISELALSAVSEAANQTLAAAAAATSAVLGREVNISPPTTHQVTELEGAPDDDGAAYVTSVVITIDSEPGRLVQLIPQAFVMRMAAAFEGAGAPEGGAADRGANAGGGPKTLSASWLHQTPLRLDVELGRVRLRADEVVGLYDGAIVTLDRSVNDPIEMHVNGVPFASGRLLLHEGQWAVVIEALQHE